MLSTARHKKAGIPPQSEKDFMAAIVKLAAALGWRTFHVFDSRRSAAGFPDLVLMKMPRLVFFECKREGGKLTDAQFSWLESLQMVGGNVEAYAVWPSEWPWIVRILEGRAP